MSKYILDGDLCKNFFYFHIFSFSVVFKHDFIRCLILPISQLQTQQVMKSQIKSHIEYLIHDLLYSFAHFIVKINEKFSLNYGFNTIQWWYFIVAYFFGPPRIHGHIWSAA